MPGGFLGAGRVFVATPFLIIVLNCALWLMCLQTGVVFQFAEIDVPRSDFFCSKSDQAIGSAIVHHHRGHTTSRDGPDACCDPFLAHPCPPDAIVAERALISRETSVHVLIEHRSWQRSLLFSPRERPVPRLRQDDSRVRTIATVLSNGVFHFNSLLSQANRNVSDVPGRTNCFCASVVFA